MEIKPPPIRVIFLGTPEFSLRAKTGLDFTDLETGIAYAHKLKKKAYVTINIFAHEEQLARLPEFLRRLKILKPDAIILSDPGVLLMVKKYLPSLPIHLSTQANTLNSAAVKFWRRNGVKRIILGREASLEDIKKIHRAEPKMELEVFVQGAMCLSYSGRCYLSAEFSRRSANSGLCVQPCRWQYNLYAEETTRPGKFLPLQEDAKGLYIFNSKDLSLIDYLQELIKAGVVSFKIEGRTKSHYYVADAVGAYRQALDNLSDKKILAVAKKELSKIDNRGYMTGFLIPTSGIARQNLENSKAESQWQLVGEVVSHEKNLIEIKIHNALKVGDEAELLAPKKVIKFKIKKLLDQKGK